MPFRTLLLLFTTAWITTITTSTTLCNPKDFELIQNLNIVQGGLSYVGVYLYKRDNTTYIRKLIPKQTVPGKTELKGLKSFTTEVKILDHLKNSGVAPKLLCASELPTISLPDYTKKAGQVYLMMEMIRGESLASILSLTDNPKVLQNILKKTARRIYELHKNGVIHLDIKPDNIMVDDTGEVKLIDFGGSYSAYLQLPKPLFHCTPYYCHPSLKAVRKGTPAMDWYSFGVTAYFSRLFQLNPDKDVFDIKNAEDLTLLPENETGLYEVIRLCREGMPFDGSYTELYEKVIELDYFK